MQFRISYTEAEQLISSKSGKELPMSYGGPHTVRISYKVPLMSSVGLDITVDRVFGSDIYLSFGGGAGIEFMLRSALSQAQGRPGGDMLEMMGGNQLRLMLGKNPQTAQLFDRITLEDIMFDEQWVIIDFTPKPF